MDTPTLEEVIRQHVAIPPRPNGRGFFSVLCKVCNDHGKKGKRAGFKFQGDSVGYHCFNCGHSCGFDPNKHEKMPNSMIEVFEAYGIPKVDWEPVLFRAMANRQDGTNDGLPASTYVSIEPEIQKFPPFFYPLENDPYDEFAQYSIEYLTERRVDWKQHPFYLVHKMDHPENKKWYGRLIIPIYKDTKLIFWQGRDLTDMHQKRYLSPTISKDNILSGYDRIREYTDEPLYITEGWFDAYHVQGVATLGNRLMEPQIKWINQAHRQKVVIPDRFGDGHLLARAALDLGWSISLPDIGSCKDVNDAIIKYGELYTKTTIIENTFTGFEAEARLGIYCEQSTSKKTYKRTPR
jgi:hypothetical protein